MTEDARERFMGAIAEKNYEVMKARGDGFCLFHSLAMGMGRAGEGQIVRDEIIERMVMEKETLADKVANFDLYIERLRDTGWGDETEIEVAKRLYGIDIAIWTADQDTGASMVAGYDSELSEVMLAYFPGEGGNGHYDLITKTEAVF